MKKKSPPYAIIGAVVLGIFVVVLFFQWKKQQDAAENAKLAAMQQQMNDAIAAAQKSAPVPLVSQAPTASRNVLYATQPVTPGMRISPSFYEKKLTPNDILPDAFNDQSDITGFFAIRQIEKGDPLTPRNIGKSLPYMSQRITPGMRAISIPVFNAQPTNLTGGFIVDGDRVDLLWTSTTPEGAYQTQFILQNLNVLFVPGSPIKTDKSDGINPAGPPLVTFEVTPEQAQALIYLQTTVKAGTFNMILRARQDESEIKIKPFAGLDYLNNLKKVQSMSDKSETRVQQLEAQIEAEAKNPGTTNETVTPPSP